ncbi:hypothetical protein AOR13_3207 [Alteromonas stellipolaris LMG 21856]|nr:hypothetical protein AOR13_3207 [Alteromonas stellipolaris LMG 21856]
MPQLILKVGKLLLLKPNSYCYSKIVIVNAHMAALAVNPV